MIEAHLKMSSLAQAKFNKTKDEVFCSKKSQLSRNYQEIFCKSEMMIILFQMMMKILSNISEENWTTVETIFCDMTAEDERRHFSDTFH